MLFFVEIPIKIIKAIWENIFIELFKNKININPPNIAKGTVKFEYKGEGEFTLYPGDVVYQPPEIHHREIEHSDDLELIEITSPSEFETVKL